MRRPGKYLLWLATTLLLLLGGVAAVNRVVDPYGIFGPTRLGDRLKSRPAIRKNERLHKAYAVARANAETLILGSSRAEVGLDPRHPALLQPAYNLGLSGARAYECLRYLQHASALHLPKLVLLAIDPSLFDLRAEPGADFLEKRLAVRRDGAPQPWWRLADVPDTLLSASALLESGRALVARGPVVTYAQGMRDEGLMRFEEGHDDAGKRGDLSAVTLIRPDGSNPQLEAFRQLARFCREHGVRLIVFTNPVNAIELDRYLDRREQFSWWLREVRQTLREECAAAEFWDFFGYNEITREAFPRPAARPGEVRLYWEVSHYRKALGDLVLDRIFGRATGPEGFGRIVTVENVTEDLARLDRERAAAKEAAAAGVKR